MIWTGSAFSFSLSLCSLGHIVNCNKQSHLQNIFKTSELSELCLVLEVQPLNPYCGHVKHKQNLYELVTLWGHDNLGCMSDL